MVGGEGKWELRRIGAREERVVGGTYKKGGKRDLESKELLAMLNMWQSKKQLKLLGQVLKGQKTGMEGKEGVRNWSSEEYSWLQITRTLNNLNFPLTQSNFCFFSDHFYINLLLITQTMFWALIKSRKKTVYWHPEHWTLNLYHWRVAGR